MDIVHTEQSVRIMTDLLKLCRPHPPLPHLPFSVDVCTLRPPNTPYTIHPTLPQCPAPSLPPGKMWSSPIWMLMTSSLPTRVKCSRPILHKNWLKSSCDSLHPSKPQS